VPARADAATLVRAPARRSRHVAQQGEIGQKAAMSEKN